ncbi:hypothetical protein C8Q80DRAFT_684587 [Daedaleopsis nitida]|nr:hypothetical protein C8Q80DRAFT_684587 [Daedaleopsis nitida]
MSSSDKPPSVAATLQASMALSIEHPDDAKTEEEDECFVIVAQDVRFMVHRSRIESRSAALDALLKLPVDNPQERISNCPVIRVEDTAHDFLHLLYILYGLCKPHMSVAPHFRILAAWARIGTKYDLQDLAAHTLTHLRILFPTTLAGWDNRDAAGRRDRFRPQNAIEALNLFRAVGRPDMVPAAVYLCAQLPPRTIRKGTRRTDGVPEKLCAADVALVLHAQDCLRRHGARVLESACCFARAAPDECARTHDSTDTESASASDTRVDACYDTLVSKIRVASAGVMHSNSQARALVNGDPLHRGFLEYIAECADADDHAGIRCVGVCSACVRPAREHFESLRATVWEDLPRIAEVQNEIMPAWGLDVVE